MAVRFRSQIAIMPFLRVIGATASCLLLVAGCSSSPRSACGPGQKCPAPPLPVFTVHLGISGKAVSLVAGGYTKASVRRGTPTSITLSIDRPANVIISDVNLVVLSAPSHPGDAEATGPSAHDLVITHRDGLLHPAETLSATWIPRAQSGAKTLSLGITVVVGNAKVSWPLATVTVTV